MPEQSQRNRNRFAFSHHDLDAHTTVVAIEGDCDLASAPTLKWALVDLLAGGRSRLILDLSAVSFMDSTALGALVGIEMSLKSGETLVLAAAPSGVLSLLELTGLDRRFSHFSTVEGAVGHVVGDADQTPSAESLRMELEHTLPALGDPGSDRSELTRDAALALGIAATAVPFARSRPAQAERWLRALYRCGGAGVALSTLGVGDFELARVPSRGPFDDREGDAQTDPDAVGTITDHARRLADGRRGSGAIRTTDLLEAVVEVYGSDLDVLLTEYGTNCSEVTELLAGDLEDVSDR